MFGRSRYAAGFDTGFRQTRDDRFAYRLTCRRVLHTMNGAYRGSDEMLRRFPVNFAHMNPDDMTDSGLKDGDIIEIESEFGRVKTAAKAEPQLRRGVVSMSHMFGKLISEDEPYAEGGANVGELTSLERWLEPINNMPRFSGIPVNVRRG